ncbi:MAG: DegV family protein [Bacillota bacterium]
MHKIKLITDSTCDLSPDLIKRYDIEVIPLYVNLDGTYYKDSVELTAPKMYEKVEKTGALPKTAAASSEDFKTVFEKYLNEGYDILYTGIGSKFSSTLQSANIARMELETGRIHLVDSQNLSSGSGVLLLKAASLREEGRDIVDIMHTLESMVPKVRSQFVIDTLEYLQKGGRLKAISAFMGTMLKIKPIIRVVEGEMAVGKKARGNIRNGIKIQLKEVIKHLTEIDPEFIMITHTEAFEAAKLTRKALEETEYFENILTTEAGCVISSHCGPGTIGLLYIMK